MPERARSTAYTQAVPLSAWRDTQDPRIRVLLSGRLLLVRKRAPRDGLPAEPGHQPPAPGRPRQHRRRQPPPLPRPTAHAKAASGCMNAILPCPWPRGQPRRYRLRRKPAPTTGRSPSHARRDARASTTPGPEEGRTARKPPPARRQSRRQPRPATQNARLGYPSRAPA
jgi:hypothetical protein